MRSITPGMTAPPEPAAPNGAVRADDRIAAANDLSSAPAPAAALPASVSLRCVQGFAPAALAGAVIALVAPVAFVRVLGLVAVGAGVLGVLLHAYLLRRDHPTAWNRWFATQRLRIGGLRARWIRENPSAGRRAGGPHGFARFAPVMAQEN